MEAIMVLTEFQNSVRVFENRTIAFCRQQIPSSDVFFMYSPLIAQNSTYLKAGETLEITAGVGGFVGQANPKFKIRGMALDINDSGFVRYTMKAPLQPGTYSIPLEIDYNDYRVQKHYRQNIKFTVIR
jgi:hypothetical protein